MNSQNSLEVNQVLTERRGNISFVAEGPLEQFHSYTWVSAGLIMDINIYWHVLTYSVKYKDT